MSGAGAPAAPRLSGPRVRNRLMGAFGVLLAGAVALAALGWFVMQRTQAELRAYEDEVLPQIGSALELAERISRLAATAPQVAESPTPERLDVNSSIARGLIREIRQRSGAVDQRGALQQRLAPFIELGDSELLRLIEVTQQRQTVRDRLQSQMERLERVGRALHTRGTGAGGRAVGREAQIWSSLVLGAGDDAPATLGRLEADVEALLIALRRDRSEADGAPLDDLVALAEGPEGILALRRRLLQMEVRSNALVTLTRSNADRLTELVGEHVQQLRSTTRDRSTLVRTALVSGQTGLLVLTILCIAVALAAALFVRQVVAQLERITAVMSRLADGDTAVPTPAVTRPDELGALARTFEVFRDALLARERLVDDLRRQGELLAAVHNSMNDGLVVFDRDGRMRLWNRALERLFSQHGRSDQHVFEQGESVATLLARLPDATAWMLPGDPARHPLGTEVPPFADQPHVELHLPGQQVLDVRSRAMQGGGLVSLVTDLSERRAVETQLQHARQLDMLGRLTGGVAHDFHNHLGTIIGNLGMLAAQPGLDAAGEAQRSRALRAAESAARLTRRLLAFARRQPLQAEWVAVDSMIEEMADLIEYSAGPRVVLDLALASGDARLHLDRGQLENALLNLAINSGAAMPAGGRLTIATALDAGRLRITVADTGSGIPEALLHRVLEPFFTTKRGGSDAERGTGEGSGLGLSIVYGFVKQSGGAMQITSRVGEGTQVALAFPLAGPAQALPPPEPAGSGAPSSFAGLTLLLVDDDLAFRQTMVEMLQDLGAGVSAVDSAEAALALLAVAADPPDLLLTDLRLGDGLDGRRLALQVQERWPGVRVALMSGMPHEDSIGEMRWPFLAKPFTQQQLAAWLAVQVASPVPA